MKIRYGDGSFFVSIPHRYSKDSGAPGRLGGPERVSIPHRYSKDENKERKVEYDKKVSIPHRYSKDHMR